MNERSKQLIMFAWSIDIIGVIGGTLNSAYTTFGDHLPDTLLGYFPLVPMVAVAIAEVGRVPLASVLYHKKRLIRALALLGIIALSYLAVEKWWFGFERIVDIRLKPINQASQQLANAQGKLAALEKRRVSKASNETAKRDELRKGTEKTKASIAELNAQLAREPEVHQKNLEQIREACKWLTRQYRR